MQKKGVTRVILFGRMKDKINYRQHRLTLGKNDFRERMRGCKRTVGRFQRGLKESR